MWHNSKGDGGVEDLRIHGVGALLAMAASHQRRPSMQQ
jgi:hypothetical protein